MEADGKIRNFTDLDAWRVSHELCVCIYRATESYPTSQKHSLANQMQRASVSIGSNIAEGFGRFTAKDQQRFFYQALGSTYELNNQILLSQTLGFLSPDMATELNLLTQRAGRLLNGLITSSKRNEIKKRATRNEHRS